jgi:hypothetical protein
VPGGETCSRPAPAGHQRFSSDARQALPHDVALGHVQMGRPIGMKKKLGWIASLAALAALATTLAAATASATTTPVVVEVSGTQVTVDPATGASEMHGSLVGSWVFTKFTPRYASASQFVATAKELFTGCLDSNTNGACDKKEPAGTLRFTMMYWATFDPASGALVHGQCVHPVTGGTGSFRKAAGVIFMDDVPNGTEVVTTYKGTIEYDASKAGSGAAKHRSLSSAKKSAAAHGAGCGS